MRNHDMDLLLGEATLVDVILEQLVKKWFLQKVKLDIMQELFLLMGRTDHKAESLRISSSQY